MKYILIFLILTFTLNYVKCDLDVNTLTYNKAGAVVVFSNTVDSLENVTIINSLVAGTIQVTGFSKTADKTFSFPIPPAGNTRGGINFCTKTDCTSASWNPIFIESISIYSNNTIAVVGRYLDSATTKNELTINNVKLKATTQQEALNLFDGTSAGLASLTGSGPFPTSLTVRLDATTSNIAVKILDVSKLSNDQTLIYVGGFAYGSDSAKLTVSIDSKSVNFVLVNDTLITIDMKANNVQLGNRAITVATSSANKTISGYIGLPMNITSASSPSIYGGPIQIAGVNFPNGVTVAVGPYACAVTASTAASIACTIEKLKNDSTQLANLPVKLTIGSTSVTSNFNIAFSDVPTIIDISMVSVTGGNVTIQGTNFKTPVNPVFKDHNCTVQSSNATSIICKVPAGSGAKYASTFDVNGFSLTKHNKTFSYYPPTVTGVSNITEKGGELRINGTNFAKTGLSVLINSNQTCEKPTLIDDKTVTCQINGTYLHKLGLYDQKLSISVTVDGQGGSGKLFSYSQEINQTTEVPATPTPNDSNPVSTKQYYYLAIIFFSSFILLF